MESTIDLNLHVQYTVNVNVEYFRNIRSKTSKVDVLNPNIVPVHLQLREGDYVQKYTIELSTNPAWVTTSNIENKKGATNSINNIKGNSNNGNHNNENSNDGNGNEIDGSDILAGIQSGSIEIQIIDTCSQRTTDGTESELEVLNINQQPSRITSFVINGTQETPLTNWSTRHTPIIKREINIRTYDNVRQNKNQITKCFLRHYITPTNGIYTKWDVALVVGSRDRIPWEAADSKLSETVDVVEETNEMDATKRHPLSGILIGKMSKIDLREYSSEGAAREWSTVVDISIHPSSFKPVSWSLSRSPLSKTPKQIFF